MSAGQETGVSRTRDWCQQDSRLVSTRQKTGASRKADWCQEDSRMVSPGQRTGVSRTGDWCQPDSRTADWCQPDSKAADWCQQYSMLVSNDGRLVPAWQQNRASRLVSAISMATEWSQHASIMEAS